jgi:hypothetical protein
MCVIVGINVCVLLSSSVKILNVYCLCFVLLSLIHVYFVRRGLHISWYILLSNPIVYVQ